MVTDAHLISATLEGDLTAFDDLMQRYQRLVFTIARNYVRDDEDAMDITQEVFISTYQKMHAISQPKQFKSWLIRVCYNACATFVRRRRDETPLEWVAEPSHQAETLQSEHSHTLTTLLNCLRPRQRLAVVLKYIEGFAISEIAEVLDCSEGNVKNILYRSMRKLSAAAQ